MILIYTFQLYNLINLKFYYLLKLLVNNFLHKMFFLYNFFLINEIIWQEGFLIDFLQKLLIDKWTKSFLVYSAYLFNERLVFDNVIKFYLDYIIWPMHKLSIFNVQNVSWMLLHIIVGFLFFFILISLINILHIL